MCNMVIGQSRTGSICHPGYMELHLHLNAVKVLIYLLQCKHYIMAAFVCSRIDYCNSLLVGLPKVRLSPIQSVLNAAARLVGRLPRTSHISTFMFDHLHWLPLI